jgi:UDP-N-acetylmuramate--alanine ligase
MNPSILLRRLHFVGIGGSGMSALAEVMSAWGFRISGSDGQDGETLARLRALGLRVESGHRAGNLGDVDAVVYSSAVPSDNPELEAARRRGIPVVRRAEMLGEVMRGKYSLAVAGTHGKTTTTTMLGKIWLAAGREPTILAGGSTRGESFGAVAGRSNLLIAEADEYDRSFLAMWPTAAVVGNIDADHLDCYGDIGAVREAFLQFLARLPFHGLAVVNRDDEGVRAILPRLAGKAATFGLSAGADYRAVDVRAEAGGMAFALERGKVRLGEVTLKVPGIHNVYNALGAAALSLEEGLGFSEVARGLGDFQGVKRRLELKGERRGIAFYDDYAHHPTEVSAALQAARVLAAGRLVAVFQPHLYSRTGQLYREFAAAFQGCDELFVTRVYAARELPVAGVEGNLITDEARTQGLPADRVHYVEDPGSLPAHVSPGLRAGDLVITMGAGDIGDYGAKIMEAVA